MKSTTRLMAMMAVAGCTSALSAQTVTFQLQRVENFFGLAVTGNATAPNNFFVGRAATIEVGNDSKTWFLGGVGNSSFAGSTWNQAICKVTFANLDGGTRTFWEITSSRRQTDGATRLNGYGYISLSMDKTNNRLLAFADGFGSSDWLQYDTTPAGYPILINSLFDFRKTGGAAWDYGPQPSAGNPGLPAYIKDALPLVSTLDGGYAGPRACPRTVLYTETPVDPNNVAGNPDGYRYFFGRNPSPLQENVLPLGATLLPAVYDANFFGVSANTTNSAYRDHDFDPETGLMVARADNTLVVAQREANNVTLETKKFRIADAQLPVANFIQHQNVKILKGTPHGDLVILNDRRTTNAGQNPFTQSQVFKVTLPVDSGTPFARLNTSWQRYDAATAAYVPATFSTGSTALVDYAWVPSEKRLLLLDRANNGDVYVFDMVSVPATINAPVENQCAEIGGTATFAAETSGDKVRYQWYKGTTLLTGQTSATLTLSNVQATDAGSYTVRVVNALASVESTATLTIGGCGGSAGCNPADIACDDGTPLAAAPGCTNSTSGPNEGDYNAFFSADGFFFQAGLGAGGVGGTCDIACDDGTPLSEAPGCTNNGVNEGDYNAFFNNLFLPCV